MTSLRALLAKEIMILFASPVAYLVLTTVAILTSIVFFEHLRLYNHQLFLYASSNMGGFESGAIPDYINLRDTVFYPVMEQLGLLLLLPIPLVTMGVFARERDTGTEELLLTSGAPPTAVVTAKFAVTLAFVALMMIVSFIYPASAVTRGGLGIQHLFAVFIGLVLLGWGIAAIGLACSALTRSQVIAAASTVAVAYLLYDFGWSYAFVSPETASWLDRASLHLHFARFSEGIVTLEDIAYFIALGWLAAAIVRTSMALRRISP